MLESEEATNWLDSGSSNGLIHGDSEEVLACFPPDSIDCVVTPPPYWGVREYSGESMLGNFPISGCIRPKEMC